MLPTARALLERFDGMQAAAAHLPADADELRALVDELHRANRGIWDQEDLARRRLAPDSEIAANKRAIDGLNQRRNDIVERIDEALVSLLADGMAAAARPHSETPGQIIDRLSILSLKIAAMRAQASRREVDDAHRDACERRLAILIEQRRDLGACLDALVADCRAGRARFKVYRQFKMYNDPALNPAVYREDCDAARTSR